MITVLAFNLLGDGLRDAMDPKSDGMGGGDAGMKKKTDAPP
jgi:hypothetical protein